VRQLSFSALSNSLGTWRPSESIGDEAYTPQWLLDVVSDISDIWTDPCWSPLSLVQPMCWAWTRGQDGLSQAWKGHTYANVPFSDTSRWVVRVCREALRGLPISMLTPLDPTTRWARWMTDLGEGLNSAYYVDLNRRVEFHRPFAKKGAGNMHCVRLYLLNHSPLDVAAALAKHDIGTLQQLGGIRR
jgi:hypothetical protein